MRFIRPSSALRARRVAAAGLLLLAVLPACEQTPPTAPADAAPQLGKTVTSGPVVSSADPAEAPRDTTLDVRVLGSGFDNGSQAVFLLDGAPVAGVRTNRTTYTSSRELVANITIALDATPDRYDIQVTTSTGKKGIGTERFEVLDLVVLGGLGGNGSTAYTLNSLGQVAGRAVRPDGSQAAFVWSNGVITPLDMPAGWTGSVTFTAIDDAGVVSGTATAGSSQAMRWVPSGGTWVRSSLPTLPGYEGGDSYVNAANSLGDVVGFVSATGVPGKVVLWRDGVAWPVNVSGAGYSSNSTDIGGINDAGWISGSAFFSGVRYAFVWRPDASGVPGSGRTILLPRYGTGINIAKGINASGALVGWTPGKNTNTALRWRPLSPDPLVTSDYVVEALPGSNTVAWSIADDGFIVGEQSGAAVRWSVTGTLSSLPFSGNAKAEPLYVRLIGGRHWVVGQSAGGAYWQATLWRVP